MSDRGTVLLDRDDRVRAEFLSFLERDMAMHNERLTPFPQPLLERALILTRGILIDHEAVIDDVQSMGKQNTPS